MTIIWFAPEETDYARRCLDAIINALNPEMRDTHRAQANAVHSFITGVENVAREQEQ